MNERYSRLFTLPAELYSEGSPLLIAAGALLKDNSTGRVIAQLKLKNLGEKAVKAVKLRLWTVSALGDAAQEPVEYTYLDLNAARSAAFGSKNPIPLPDPATRSFRAEILQVAFADGSLWNAPEGTEWTPLPEGQTLEAALGDPELCKQFRLQRGMNCRFVPARYGALWRCACGEPVLGQACPACGKSSFALDLPALTAAKDARLVKEKAEREAREAAEKAEREAREAAEKAAQEAKAAAAAARAKTTKKLLAIVLPTVAVLIAVFLILTKVVLPNNKYNAAKAMLDAGEYDAAVDAFEALGEYKDSPAQKQNALYLIEHARKEEVYQKANAYYSSGDYPSAIQLLESELLYEDCRKLYLDSCYEYIQQCWEQGDYKTVKEIASKCLDYKDVKDILIMANSKIYYQDKSYERAFNELKQVSSSYIAENKELYESFYADCLEMYAMTSGFPLSDVINLLADIPDSKKQEVADTVSTLEQLLDCSGKFEQPGSYGKTYYLTIEYYVYGETIKAGITYTNFNGKIDMGEVQWNFNTKEEYPVIIEAPGTGDYKHTPHNFTFYVSPEKAYVTNPRWDNTYTCTKIK